MTEISAAFHAGPAPREPGHAPDTGAAREAAVKLEASFLSEMLKAAGFGQPGGGFGGGVGEEQFVSFQRDAIALGMARAGGLGLAEMFFRSMTESRDDR